MKTMIDDKLLENFLEEYFYSFLDQDVFTDETPLRKHVSGNKNLLPEIQIKYAIDEATARNLIEHAHEQTR